MTMRCWSKREREGDPTCPIPILSDPKDQEAYFPRRSNVSVLVTKPRDIITKSWKSELILRNYAVA